jgi:hypothetical protein
LVRKQLAINATPELSYEAHRCLCQGAVSYLGFPGVTEVGFLDVTTSAVNRATWTDPTPELVDCHQVVSAPTSPIIKNRSVVYSDLNAFDFNLPTNTF